MSIGNPLLDSWACTHEVNEILWKCGNFYKIFSDLPPAHVEAVQITSKAPTGTIEFRDDIDLIEQVTHILVTFHFNAI